MKAIKAYQAQIGKEYYVHAYGEGRIPVPAVLVETEDGYAVFRVYENDESWDYVVELDEVVQVQEFKISP